MRRYDGELGMFCDDVRDPDIAHLRWLRWLAQRGLLEREPEGYPSGDIITRLAQEQASELVK